MTFTVDMPNDLGNRIRKAIIWRSGTQIFAQLISWVSTLAVIRILDPGDYGLFAMIQVVAVFFSILNGYGLASWVIQSEKVDPVRLRQAFGALLLLNGGLAVLQFLLAPLAAEFYRQPIIADLLRVQAVTFLATPFIVLPEALMARELEFKKTALINLLSAIIGALVALSCALSGLGVWTLVYAAIAIFWTQAIGLFFCAKMFIWPKFNFRGSGQMFTFGGAVLLAHVFWTIQSQADIFIASRSLSIYELGLYAEAMFLTTIFTAKFIPPLNEVAFPAYSRMQSDVKTLSQSFLKAVRIIMLISCPLYFGLVVTSHELVSVVLGEKWLPMAPIVSVLALVMPAMTLQILFAPASNALGRPTIAARVMAFGAFILPLGFVIGVQFGIMGLAYSWLATFPLLTAFTIYQSKPHIGFSLSGLARAVWPGFSASTTMAVIVYGVGQALPPVPDYLRLVTMVGVGGLSYVALLYWFARPTMIEIVQLFGKRQQVNLPSTG